MCYPKVHYLVSREIWYIHPMEYYSEIKRNELLILAASWKNPQNIKAKCGTNILCDSFI